VQAERRIKRSALLAVGLGVFLAQLDGTVMNVALPALARAFHQSGLRAVQPVITSYLIATVALLPILGKIADRAGRRRLFMLGFAIFGSASILCAMAPSLEVLTALRVVQAIGGALLSGTGLAIVAAYSGGSRGRSLGRLSVVFALSGLLGPPIGGGLVQAFGWQSVFWLNVPLALAGLVLARRYVPPDKGSETTGRVDVLGAGLFALSTALIAAGVGDNVGFTLNGLPISWPEFVLAGAVGFVALLAYERQLAPDQVAPLLDLGLLRSRAYGLGIVMAFLSNGVTIALFVLVPFWLQRGWHVQAGALGLVFLPVALGLGGVAPLAGKRSDTAGPRLLTTAGMAVGAVAAALLAWQATQLMWPVLLVAMLALGVSSGMFAAPNNNAVLGSAPESALGVAGSMLSAARTLGVIIGISVGGAVYDALQASRGADEAARILFIAATAIFILNSALCWAARATPSRANQTAESDQRGQSRRGVRAHAQLHRAR
jgi:EmrB/QacA subfamily drug resistance transporter